MASSPHHELESLALPKLKNFDLYNLCIDSHQLMNNSLGDPTKRNNPVLVPKNHLPGTSGLVLVLSGFAGNGTKYLADKGFEQTFIQQLNDLYGRDKAPRAVYAFVDAWTFWGGSQFINSKGTGSYENYITQELYPLLMEIFSIKTGKVAVLGQSSGGYGALHLASKFPHFFPYMGALAPDCFFEASLLPDLYKAAPFLALNKNYVTLKGLHRERQLLKQRHGFSILNAIGMTACYSPSASKTKLDWPMDFESGTLIPEVWKRWLSYDPVHFLKKRKAQLKKLKGFYLEVGVRDEFNLQLGVRQIHRWLNQEKIKHHYSEYEGGHFDGHERNPHFWEWLGKIWKDS